MYYPKALGKKKKFLSVIKDVVGRTHMLYLYQSSQVTGSSALR